MREEENGKIHKARSQNQSELKINPVVKKIQKIQK